MSFLRNHVDINIKTVQTKNFNFCYCLFDLIDLSAEEIAAMYITEFSSITKCLNFTKKLLYHRCLRNFSEQLFCRIPIENYFLMERKELLSFHVIYKMENNR